MTPILRNKYDAKRAKHTKTTAKHKPPTKPRTVVEPPPSINFRFLNNVARDRFKEIKHYRVVQERVFLYLVNLVRNLEFNTRIRTRGWQIF